MANPLFTGQFGGNSANSNVSPQLQSVINAYKNGGNPMQLVQSMAMNNPQMAGIMQMLRSNGNMQQLFYSLCQKQGVDPNSILTLFK